MQLKICCATLTVVFDLNTSAICVGASLVSMSSGLGVRGYLANQSVASVRNVNEGPRAGFRVVVENAE